MFDDFGADAVRKQIDNLSENRLLGFQEDLVQQSIMANLLPRVEPVGAITQDMLTAGSLAAQFADQFGIRNPERFVSVWPTESIFPTFDEVGASIAALGETRRVFESTVGAQGLSAALPSFEAGLDIWPKLPDLTELLEHWNRVQRGEQALGESEFAYSLHFWTEAFLARIGALHRKAGGDGVSDAVMGAIALEEFGETLLEHVRDSNLLRERQPIVEAVLRAHREKLYALAVPVAITQIEGCLGDLLLLRNAVERDGHQLWWTETGEKGERQKVKGLRQLSERLSARRESKVEPILAGVTQIIASGLSDDRNSILHGRKLDFNTESRSAEAVLVLSMLVLGTRSFEQSSDR